MRLFFALRPPEPVAQVLAGQARTLAQRFGGRATRPETIHLTLAFLGDVGEEQLPAVMEAARWVIATPFELTLDRLGFWRHNRLAWVGCSSSPAGLQALANGLCAGLRAASLPCDASQAFVPHLTLVRKVRETPIDPPAPKTVTWACDSFYLVHSQLSSSGAMYRALATFPLKGANLLNAGSAS